MKTLFVMLLLVIFSGLAVTSSVQANSFPRDNKFKQLPNSRDAWYYVDSRNWYIIAPDKWQHFMGSYALAEVTGKVTGSPVAAGLITFGLGLAKEFDDAYREGWSRRDIYMDIGGVASALLLPERIRLFADYDRETVMFKLSFIID